ncbi:WDR33-like protein, partial [Mya arenaria]
MAGTTAMNQEQGFFHMPKLQVPNYQKPRVFLPNFNQGQDGDKSRVQSGPPVYNATKFSGGGIEIDFDGKRIRKTMVRKTVDYNTSVMKYLENRIWQRDKRDARSIQPDALYQLEVTPPCDLQHKSMNCMTTKFMRQSTNKFRCPIFCISWTPEGRRLVTGASSGEFTLWNGLTFSFETILQAHETSVRAMVWSHNDQWMVTGDHAGFIKYWQTNMNNVKMYQGHKEPIRSISFCPTDSKFATSSDDGTVRIWDFLRCYEEKILRGHGADVKCVDWHPYKSLVASGSKDNQVPIKLWDPKSGQTVAWHPINEPIFASGGSDGAVMFWEAGKFWTRNRPGDPMRDKYNLNIAVIGPDGEPIDLDSSDVHLGETKGALPGMGLEYGLPPDKEEKMEPAEELPAIPGLDWSADAEFFKEERSHHDDRGRRKAPYTRPIPRSFEQAWVTNQQPTIVKRDDAARTPKIKSLLSLDIAPPPKNKEIDRDSEERDDPYIGYYGEEDEDFRQDEDMRGDEDYRGDLDFRGEEGPPSEPFNPDPSSFLPGAPSAGPQTSNQGPPGVALQQGQNMGPNGNFPPHGGPPGSGPGMAPNDGQHMARGGYRQGAPDHRDQGYHGNDSQGSYDSFDHDYRGDINDRAGSYHGQNSEEYEDNDRRYGDYDSRGRGARNQDGYRGRGRGRGRGSDSYNDRGAGGNWDNNDYHGDGENYNEGNDRGGGGGYQNQNRGFLCINMLLLFGYMCTLKTGKETKGVLKNGIESGAEMMCIQFYELIDTVCSPLFKRNVKHENKDNSNKHSQENWFDTECNT